MKKTVWLLTVVFFISVGMSQNAQSADIETRLTTSNGTTEMAIQDSDETEVFTVNSDGDAAAHSVGLIQSATNFILNQTTLQTGTTVYVSSGQVAGQISVLSVKFPDTSTFTTVVPLRHIRFGNWAMANVAANRTNDHMHWEVASASQTTTGSRMKMPFAGTAVGICVTGSAARTNGSATFQIFKNGVDIGASSDAVIDGTNTQFVCSTGGTGTFVAGDILDIRFTTDGTFTPAGSTEYNASLTVNFTE